MEKPTRIWGTHMEDSTNGGYPNSWMVYNGKSYLDIFRWMIWGYSHFGNPPYTL
jgi:hypothetical protein